MKTSEKAKLAGLNSLEEISSMTKRSTQVLRNWDKNYNESFEMLLFAAGAKKNGEGVWINDTKNKFIVFTEDEKQSPEYERGYKDGCMDSF